MTVGHEFKINEPTIYVTLSLTYNSKHAAQKYREGTVVYGPANENITTGSWPPNCVFPPEQLLGFPDWLFAVTLRNLTACGTSMDSVVCRGGVDSLTGKVLKEMRQDLVKSTVGASVQFNRSVVSDCWRPHGPQHARPPCPSPTPGVCSNSCPWSQ